MTDPTVEDLRDARRGDIVERFLATQHELARHLDANTPRAAWRAMAGRIGGDFAALYLHLAGEELAFDPPHLRSVITARRKLKEAGCAETPFMAQSLRSADAANGAAADRGDAGSKDRARHRYALLVSMHVDYFAVLAQIWDDPAALSSANELGRLAEEITASLSDELETGNTPANDSRKELTDEPA
jgi:hypothetical protein